MKAVPSIFLVLSIFIAVQAQEKSEGRIEPSDNPVVVKKALPPSSGVDLANRPAEGKVDSVDIPGSKLLLKKSIAPNVQIQGAPAEGIADSAKIPYSGSKKKGRAIGKKHSRKTISLPDTGR